VRSVGTAARAAPARDPASMVSVGRGHQTRPRLSSPRGPPEPRPRNRGGEAVDRVIAGVDLQDQRRLGADRGGEIAQMGAVGGTDLAQPGAGALHDVGQAERAADLDQLVPACAAMHKEEVGIDPLERDPVGYRERVRELVERKRSIVRLADKRIVAKTEFSAVTNDVVQLMGVWTNPQFRRRGFAHAMLREICGHLFRKGKSVTLFVNDFNTGAMALYEGLGFQRIGVNRALIW